MKRKMTFIGLITFAVILAAGCINYDQELVLNDDGSGTVKIRYTSDDAAGAQLTPVLPFSEEDIIAEYSGSKITVSGIEVFVPGEEEEGPCEAKYSLEFGNIADLNGHGIFAVKDYTGTKDAMPQVFTIYEASDMTTFTQTCTLNADVEDTTGLEYYKFTYSLTCPSTVTLTNGEVKSDGLTVTWSYTLPELVKNPVEMYAVYGESGGNGQGCVGPEKVSD